MSGGGKNANTAAMIGISTGGIGIVLALLLTIASISDDDNGMDNIGGGSETLDAHRVPSQYVAWVSRAGAVCPDVSAPLIAAQIEAESAWNPDAVSPVGAQGLSQFMPGTWASWGVDAASKDGTPKPDGIADPFTAGDAIMTQARYDCWLAQKVRSYHVPGDTVALMLAAYNAGPDAIRRYRGIPPYWETTGYVANILKRRDTYRQTGGTGEGEATQFGARVAAYARRWIGTPYAWGGGTVSGPGPGLGGGQPGFDCSALVQYAVYHASSGAVTLPRVSQDQATTGAAVQRPADIRVGDVIAFALHGAGDFDHIGIYVGGGKFVHAPKTGDVVKISSLSDYANSHQRYSEVPTAIRRMG
ncbi:NlpC/P60 family protein [Streptomyces sp. NPDC090442]|uniref:C40 family peptidase n=1 Tax=Streptomyces sp. NPDC090442 TaxID=3365962 RepID=UPI003814D5A6